MAHNDGGAMVQRWKAEADTAAYLRDELAAAREENERLRAENHRLNTVADERTAEWRSRFYAERERRNAAITRLAAVERHISPEAGMGATPFGNGVRFFTERGLRAALSQHTREPESPDTTEAGA